MGNDGPAQTCIITSVVARPGPSDGVNTVVYDPSLERIVSDLTTTPPMMMTRVHTDKSRFRPSSCWIARYSTVTEKGVFGSGVPTVPGGKLMDACPPGGALNRLVNVSFV